MLNKFKKGVSLLEALVSMFVLSMIVLAYMSTSDTFLRNQQNLVNLDRRDQIAELILQGIMEYRKYQPSFLGTVEVDENQDFDSDSSGGSELDVILTQYAVPGDASTLLTGSSVVPPRVGDVMIIQGLKGRHVVDGVSGSGRNYTIDTDKPIPAGTLADGTNISFIAFAKDDLNCFANDSTSMNLMGSHPTNMGDMCPSVPQTVRDIHAYWKNMIATELPNVTTASVTWTEDNLSNDVIIKVRIGDSESTTVQAKKINVCIHQNYPSTLKFTFPGLSEPLITGIMEGTESPLLHYHANGKSQKYNSGNSGAVSNVTASCNRVNASTCRQNYSDEDTFTVFMYKYNGEDEITWKPTNCNSGATGNWQCPGVTIREGDLSLWFLFDNFNHTSNSKDEQANYGINGAMTGYNGGGQLSFRTTNLPDGARILVFDDASESCQAAITSDGSCSGVYKWASAHDGMVIHLATDDVNNLEDITLEILRVPSDVNQWRILKTSSGCTTASNESNSLHGNQYYREEDQGSPCWTYVGADATDEMKSQLRSTLTSSLSATSTSLTVADSSIFGQSGTILIDREEIQFTSNDTSTNTLNGLTRGYQKYPVTLSESISTSAGNNSKRTLSGYGGIAFYGGYIKINSEVIRVDYASSFTDFENNDIRFVARAQAGTSKGNHAVGDTVINYDVRAATHDNGAEVWELNNSISTAMDTGLTPVNNSFPRNAMKKSVSLNLSSSSVCQ